MIDKETREKKNKILYHTNPKHILYVMGSDLPLGHRGRTSNIYMSDYRNLGISLSISGIRGATHAECFMEYRQLEKMIKQLLEFQSLHRKASESDG